MATLHKTVLLDRPAREVWDAVSDLGALHTRLVPGFVADTNVDGDSRVVTFANGTVVSESILSLDDAKRRLAWTVVGLPLTHYNAVLEVRDEGAGARVVWTTDLLPHAMAVPISAQQDQALAAMKRAFSIR